MRMTKFVCSIIILGASVEVWSKVMGASPYNYTEINVDGTVTSLINVKGGDQPNSSACEVTDYVCDSIQENVEFLGNNITTASSSVAEGCCSFCTQQSGCNAFSWSGGTCYLKSGISFTKSSTGVRSAAVGNYYCASLVTGVEYSGNNIKSSSSPTADGCCLICKNTSGCKSFSWLNSTRTCWLKSATAGSSIANATVVSGAIFF